MPTYAYECLECKHKFDVFQSMSDAPIETCEKCSGKVRKLFTPSGIIFKGSGFYVNDYKSSSGKGAASAPASCPSAGSCGSTTCPAASGE